MSEPWLNRRRFLSRAIGLSGLAATLPWGKAIAGDGSASLSEILPFDLPAASVLSTSPRHVFAHWHVFPVSFDNKDYPEDAYTQEYMTPEGMKGAYAQAGGYILERPLPRPRRPADDWALEDMLADAKQAQAIGIDAFQFNIRTASEVSEYWRLLLILQDAILRSKIDFKIFFNFDCGRPPTPDILQNYTETISVAFRKGGFMTTPDGRMMISAFMAEAWPAAFWREMFDGFRRRGIDIYFIPMFLDLAKVTPELFALSDMVSGWTGNSIGSVRNFAAFGRRAMERGKPWMAPVFPQDCRPKNGWFAEAGGSDVFRAGWMAAIESGAAMADLVTWNDYSESSEVRPSTGIQYGFYDLAAYYVAWFKMGRAPVILRDALYYFHRVEPTAGPELGARQAKPMAMKFGPGPLNQIQLVAFLTEAATLEIITSERIWSKNVPAGLQVFNAPLAIGRPRFRLVRDGRPVIELESAFTVRGQSDFQDLLYRAGSSNRPPVPNLALGRA